MPMERLKYSWQRLPDLRGLLLVVLTGGWLTGLVTDAWLLLPPLVPLCAGIGMLLVLGMYWRYALLRLSALVLLCLCLGAWRYAIVSPQSDTSAIRAWIGAAQVQIQGQIAGDPRLESQSTLLLVDTQSISLNNGQSWQETHGQIQVQILGATFDDPFASRYGDEIELTGKLSAPPDYATPELQASMAFPKMMIQERAGSPLLLLLYQLRAHLASILLQTLPQPFAALLIAIFLSLRTPALKPLLQTFNVTGVAHLIAPSGFKVTLLAGFIGTSTRWLLPGRNHAGQRLLPAERRRSAWKPWLHTLLLILCISLYTILSGGGPAALRAGIMGILLVLAPRLKRSYNVYTALALTALIMSLLDPFVLWDTGFQLSFIGTLGILLLTPLFQRCFHFLQVVPLGAYIAEIVSVTLAAQVATLPIFALSFQQISFVAPLANLASVPLLSPLLALSTLICVSGLIALPLAHICAWLVWPLLWYTTTALSWCAGLPGAYLLVHSLPPLIAWLYYALLALLIIGIFSRWQPALSQQLPHSPAISRRTRLILQGSLALLMLLTTAILTQAVQPDGRLTLVWLSNGDPAQGQALFLRSPSGQLALINQGASSTTLAQTLDTRLPFWQRSLNLAMLSDTSAADLAGLQDIITRYQVQRVADGGMLHPSLAYARWRDSLTSHDLLYTQARQGTLITLDQHVAFQVLWPLSSLHKSSHETADNALVLRLIAPGLSLLLLNSAALSNYALQTLALSLAPSLLQSNIVQLVGEEGKAFPSSLLTVLTLVHPSLLLLTMLPSYKRQKTAQPVAIAPPTSSLAGPWEILQNQQISSLEIQSSGHTWEIHPPG